VDIPAVENRLRPWLVPKGWAPVATIFRRRRAAPGLPWTASFA